MCYRRLFCLLSITLLMFISGFSKENDAPKPSMNPVNMVLVPTGPYSMGADSFTASQPIHTVHVPAFYMDIYEVTNAQYRAFCDSTSRPYPPALGFDGMPGFFNDMPNYFSNPTYANYPVAMVSWDDARAYSAWAGKRLPTEAEWERAAKGNTDNRHWPWGNTWIAANANIANSSADRYAKTSPVGTYPNGISPAGCYDMAGNVSEWCEDDYHESYTDAPTDGSPWIDSPRGSSRVLRGGSGFGNFSFARCDYRGAHLDPAARYPNVGFRCARTP